MPFSTHDFSLPTPGDFWSTCSSSSHPGFLVLIADSGDGGVDDDGGLLGYPLFAEDDAATGACFLLDGSPEFQCLLDERWVNFQAPVKLDADALFECLGHSQHALDCLHAFRNGRQVPLENGVPMIRGVGDPREAFHQAMAKELIRLAGASLFQLVFDRIKKTISKKPAPLRRPAFEEFGVMGCFKSLMDAAPLAGCFAAAPGSNAKESALSRMKELFSSGAVETTVEVNGHEVRLRLRQSFGRIRCEISSPELIAVEVSSGLDDEWMTLEHAKAPACFATPPLDNRSVRLLLSFDDGTSAPIDLDLRADE